MTDLEQMQHGRSLASNGDALLVLASQLLQGMPLSVCHETQPGLLRYLEQERRIDWSVYPHYTAAMRSEFFACVGVGESVPASSSNPPPTCTTEAAPAVFTDDDKRRIVTEAPERGLVAWLAERGVPRIEFYRWRAAFGPAAQGASAS